MVTCISYNVYGLFLVDSRLVVDKIICKECAKSICLGLLLRIVSN